MNGSAACFVDDESVELRALSAVEIVGLRELLDATMPPRGRRPPPAPDAAHPSSAPARVGRLTPRERAVLHLMAQGCSNQAISGELFLSRSAVAKHINNIFTKLGLALNDSDNRRVRAVLAYLEAVRP